MFDLVLGEARLEHIRQSLASSKSLPRDVADALLVELNRISAARDAIGVLADDLEQLAARVRALRDYVDRPPPAPPPAVVR